MIFPNGKCFFLSMESLTASQNNRSKWQTASFEYQDKNNHNKDTTAKNMQSKPANDMLGGGATQRVESYSCRKHNKPSNKATTRHEKEIHLNVRTPKPKGTTFHSTATVAA